MSIEFDLSTTTLTNAQLVGLAVGRETQDVEIIIKHLERAGYKPGSVDWIEGLNAGVSMSREVRYWKTYGAS